MLHDDIQKMTLHKLKSRHAELGAGSMSGATGAKCIQMSKNLKRPCFIYSNITLIEDILIRETEGFEDYAAGVSAADFRPIKTGDTWGAGVVTGWLKLRFTLPESFAGKPAAALLNLGLEGCVFENGTPAQGIDVFHEEFLLAENAEAGKTYEFVVEGRPGAFWLGDMNPATIKRAEIATINRKVEQYWYALGFLIMLAEQLPETSVRRAKLIRGMDESVKLFDFSNLDESALRESATRAYSALAPLLDKPADASALEFTCCGHSHIDTAWLWPYAETVRKCSRTFSTVDRLMDQFPNYIFSQSQPQLYEFTKDAWPELYERIKARVAEGRWEPIGAMWVEPDTNVTSGESLVRQCLFGKRFFESEFGVDTNVLWLPDVFGYSAALPQILKKAGVDYFTTIKLSWSQFNKFPYSSFWWQGIDGTKILTHCPPNGDYNSEIIPVQLLKSQSEYREKDRSSIAMLQYGWGDGGGGANKDHLTHLDLARDLEGLPKLTPGRGHDFFEKLDAESDTFPTWQGELYLELHRGTYTTQARTKYNNRKCEFMLRDAEMLSSVAMLLGRDYPQDDLNQAWKILLKNQFHDVIPGSSVAAVYKDADVDYAEVKSLAGAAIEQAASFLIENIDTTGEGHPIVVFNTLSVPRMSVTSVELPDEGDYAVVDGEGDLVPSQISTDGKRIGFLACAPGCGYITYRLIDADLIDTEEEDVEVVEEEEQDDSCGCGSECGCGHHHDEEPEREGLLIVTPTILENDFFTVELDESGMIISIFDKAAEREIVPEGARANELQLMEDKPIYYEAWDVDFFFDEKTQVLSELESIEVAEEGPLFGSLRVVRRFGGSRIEQKIVIYADIPRLDFVTEVDWQERKMMLKVAFPVDINADKARYEIQFGNVERPTHASTSWDFAKFEVCGHRWADLSEGNYGVSLLNDCKYGHDIRDGVMRLTLLRGPVDPDPTADLGHHRMIYSIYPHAGDYAAGDTMWMAYDLNVPMHAFLTSPHEGKLPTEASWFTVDTDHVVLDTIKKAEDDNAIVIRLYEAYNRRGPVGIRAGFPIQSAAECDLMEKNPTELNLEENEMRMEMAPFEIKTVKISY